MQKYFMGYTLAQIVQIKQTLVFVESCTIQWGCQMCFPVHLAFYGHWNMSKATANPEYQVSVQLPHGKSSNNQVIEAHLERTIKAAIFSFTAKTKMQ